MIMFTCYTFCCNKNLSCGVRIEKERLAHKLEMVGASQNLENTEDFMANMDMRQYQQEDHRVPVGIEPVEVAIPSNEGSNHPPDLPSPTPQAPPLGELVTYRHMQACARTHARMHACTRTHTRTLHSHTHTYTRID
jgi:hypothetical protein